MSERIACIQMTSTSDIKQNLKIAEELIKKAAATGAGLVILPEMFALMGMDERDKLTHCETLDHGPLQYFLHNIALQEKIWLVGGTIPIASSDHSKVYASSLLINDKGERIARYDKIHLFDVHIATKNETYAESNTILPGQSPVVVPTPFGYLGIAVCYDLRFPELFRQMLAENMEILALPAAFTYATGEFHWEVLVRARAIENLIYVAASCQTGLHDSRRKTYGHSMIVNPWGEIMAVLPHETGIISAEIDLAFQQKRRTEFPVLTHRRF